MRAFVCAGMIVAAAFCGSAGQAKAAMLSGSVLTAGLPSPANLTTLGTLDWALWTNTSAGTAASFSPNNTKSGGLGAITAITPVSTATPASMLVRGGITSSQQFQYSDGSSPASFGPGTAGHIFNSDLDEINAGVQLSITGNPGEAYVVNLWASGVSGQGTLTATLDGAAPVVLLSQNYPTTDPKAPTLFTFTFQPDEVSDLLNLSYVLTTDLGVNAHVGFQAVAISPVPEPGTWLLAATAGVGFLGWRRRKVQSAMAE